MVLLEENAFLVELGKLYEKNQKSGTVYITMKRFLGTEFHKKQNTKKKETKIDESKCEPTCLVRAQANKGKKISTVIPAKAVVRFQMALGNVMRLNLDGLKKRDKTKDKIKAKEKRIVKKKEGTPGSPKAAPAPKKKGGGSSSESEGK